MICVERIFKENLKYFRIESNEKTNFGYHLLVIQNNEFLIIANESVWAINAHTFLYIIATEIPVIPEIITEIRDILLIFA